MLEQPLYDLTEEDQKGHPHDLLARLYREIGISAVAAALEVSKSVSATEQLSESVDSRSTVTRADLAA
jgi:hypothetical protein